jgi:hypothetical protein
LRYSRVIAILKKLQRRGERKMKRGLQTKTSCAILCKLH